MSSPLLPRRVPQLQGHPRAVHAHGLHAVIDACGGSRASCPSPEATPQPGIPSARGAALPLQLLTGGVGRDRALGREARDLGSGPVSAADRLWDLDPVTEPL